MSMCFQVATFILQKILLDETGLSYICQTYERFSHVAMILVRIKCFLSIHVLQASSSLQKKKNKEIEKVEK